MLNITPLVGNIPATDFVGPIDQITRIALTGISGPRGLPGLKGDRGEAALPGDVADAPDFTLLFDNKIV